jgi:hypothetical protein
MKSRTRVESSYLAQGPFADQGPAQWSFIAAPTFDLPEAAGAVKYRFTIVDWRKKKEVASFEADEPWRPLTPVWDTLPAGDFEMTVTGLDAGGQPVGELHKVKLPKRASFNGPYFKRPRTITEAALMHARWLRDHPRALFSRGLNLEIGHASDGADTHLSSKTLLGVVGPLVAHELAADPRERADALEWLINTSDLWLKNLSVSPLPDTYGGWIFEDWYVGEAWLELYRITGDPQYADAARLLAKRLGEAQLPSGAWNNTEPNMSKPKYDEKTGLYPVVGGWPEEWDPSSILYFLGRVRKELKTDEFKPIEDKAWQFQVDNTLRRFDFRKQGPSESRRLKHPWKTVADNAMHLLNYLALDLPDRPIDRQLMEDLARWSEDRAVEWTRPGQGIGLYGREVRGDRLTPYADEENTPTVRMAEMYARLAAHTGNKLHRAKAEALVSTALAAQNPISGQIHASFDTSPEAQGNGCADGGCRGEYIGLAMWRLAQLWEGRK